MRSLPVPAETMKPPAAGLDVKDRRLQYKVRVIREVQIFLRSRAFMKKKQIMLGLACFAALNAGNYALASDNPFATVPQSTGYYEDVASLVHDGLIDGYTDADFNSKRPLTRYEMAVFTAKAMSKSGSAGAADTQRIQKLMKEFQSELTDMHVKIPGVKAKKADKKASGPKLNVKHLPDGWDFSGMIRYRLDGGTKKYPDGTKKSGADGFGGTKNHQVLYQLNNKFKMGGGWTAEVDTIGAYDGDGDYRTTGENTAGWLSANKVFAQGPLFGGRARIGRTKGSFIGIKKSLIMGQYYTGGDYMINVGNKWKVGAAWGNVDYNKNSWSGDSHRINSSDSATLIKNGKTAKVDASTLSASQLANLNSLKASKLVSFSSGDTIDNTSGKVTITNTSGADITIPVYYSKPDRGVSGSDMNPDGLGVSMTQLQAQYQAASNLQFNFSYWHLHSSGDHTYLNAKKAAQNAAAEAYGISNLNKPSTYTDPDIGEISAVWNPTKDLKVQAFYAQSNYQDPTYGGQNKAYALTFNLGEAKAAIPHSRMWELDLIHQERYTGIKSAYDLKNKEGEGQHGLILEYRYVPVKNVMFDWRWMHYKAINCKAASQYTGNQYRFQLYYYF